MASVVVGALPDKVGGKDVVRDFREQTENDSFNQALQEIRLQLPIDSTNDSHLTKHFFFLADVDV